MVAEVASRFEDTRAFLSAMTQLGFRTVSKVCPQGLCLGLGAPGAREPREGVQGGGVLRPSLVWSTPGASERDWCMGDGRWGCVRTGVESWERVWKSWGPWGHTVAVWDAGWMGC